MCQRALSQMQRLLPARTICEAFMVAQGQQRSFSPSTAGGGGCGGGGGGGGGSASSTVSPAPRDPPMMRAYARLVQRMGVEAAPARANGRA